MAAASVSAVVISVGAVAPVYAAGNGGHGKAHASQAHASAHRSQGGSHANTSSGSTSGEDADEANGQSETEGQAQAKGQAQSNKKSEDQQGGSQEGQTKTSESHGSSSASSSSADDKSGTPASSQGKGHTPVTVCHLLGNGGYHLLTFDQHALRAHLAHGDVYPDSTGACPSAPSSSAATTSKSHGHTPVTVCHLLGNGGYHLLTFDQHALKAHLAHGDVYPTDGTCPVPGSMTKGSSTTSLDTEITKTIPTETTTTTSTSSKTETSEAASSVATKLSTVPTRILGVQAARGPRVLGVEAFRAGTATTAAGTTPSAQIVPTAGLLPNTGAARIGLPLVAGFGLLAAGVGLLLRRRGAARG